jgi:hypothetical protein
VKDFLRRITLPIVLAVIGVQIITLNFATLERREFYYITREGSSRTFAAAQNPAVYWPVTIGIFALGGSLIAIGAYLFFRRPIPRPLETVPSASGLRPRAKLFWFVVNIATIPLGLWTGYGAMAPENLRGTNPDQFLCLAVLVVMPFFVLGTLWLSRAKYSSFHKPSFYRNPLRWDSDPLQALFITTLGTFGLAIGSQIRIAGSGSVGFWMVMVFWSILVGLVIGQALGYWIFRRHIVAE